MDVFIDVTEYDHLKVPLHQLSSVVKIICNQREKATNISVPYEGLVSVERENFSVIRFLSKGLSKGYVLFWTPFCGSIIITNDVLPIVILTKTLEKILKYDEKFSLYFLV